MNDVEYEVRIGDSDEDFHIALRAMRSWKMCDALRSTGDCPCLNIHQCHTPLQTTASSTFRCGHFGQI